MVVRETTETAQPTETTRPDDTDTEGTDGADESGAGDERGDVDTPDDDEPASLDELGGAVELFGVSLLSESLEECVLPTTTDGFTWTGNCDNPAAGARITSYDPTAGLGVTIPSSFTYASRTFPVTAIGEGAFWNTGLTSLTIPDTVTTIGDHAFRNNPGLTSVALGNSVATIGQFAFYSDSLESLTIPASVTTIGAGAFRGNPLPDVTFQGAAPSIARAFVGGLNGSFGPGGAAGPTLHFLPRFGADQVAGGFTAPTWMGYNTSSCTPVSTTNDGFAWTGDCTTGGATVTGYTGPGGAVTIPASFTHGGHSFPVTTIGFFAFESKGLTSVVLPSSLVWIDHRAFAGNALSSVAIPNSVTTIDEEAFARNVLTAVTLPDTLTTISKRAFEGNVLETIAIPATVTAIGDGAFAFNRLATIAIPAAVISIGADAFSSNELTSLTIPDSVTTIGARAFGENPLASVTFDGAAPTIVAGSDANGSFGVSGDDGPIVFFQPEFHDDAPGVTDGFTTPLWESYRTFADCASYPTTADGLTWTADDCTDPTAGATIIGYDAAAGPDLVIPDSFTHGGHEFPVTAIDDSALMDKGLTSLTLPESLTTIGEAAFAGNELTSVVIPASVTDIGARAFGDNPLAEVIFDGPPPAITPGDADGASFGPAGDDSPRFYFQPEFLHTVFGPGGFTVPTWSGYRATALSGPTQPTASVTSLDVQPGETQTARAAGFAPGEVVKGEQRSTPLDLGAQIADETGAVAFTWTIRPDETIGEHWFWAIGETGSAGIAFDVAPEPPASTEPTLPDETAVPDETTIPADTLPDETTVPPRPTVPDGELPATGSGVGSLVMIAIALVTLGIIAVTLIPRRTAAALPGGCSAAERQAG